MSPGKPYDPVAKEGIHFPVAKLYVSHQKGVHIALLRGLRAQGCRVFHDITADSFNLDHVLVSIRGIYAVETKTYSKPAKGDAVILFDGRRILVDGFEPDRNPVIQVCASGRWLQEMLAESTGREFAVKGVVLLPGWYVKNTGKGKPDVWVLNEKALPSFIENEPVVLSEEDVALISSRITLYMQEH